MERRKRNVCAVGAGEFSSVRKAFAVDSIREVEVSVIVALQYSEYASCNI